MRWPGGCGRPPMQAPHPEMTTLLDDLRAIVGDAHVLTGDDDALAAWERDWRKRYRGRARCVVLPGSADEVAAVVRRCAR